MSFSREAEQLVYQEFIRQKYLKYRHKFPRLNEQMVFQKIRKEWEQLTPPVKANIHRMYRFRGLLSDSQAKREGTQKMLAIKSESIAEKPTEKKEKQGGKSPKAQLLEQVDRSLQEQARQTRKKKKEQELIKKYPIFKNVKGEKDSICTVGGEIKLEEQTEMNNEEDSPIEQQPRIRIGQNLSQKIQSQKKQSIDFYKKVLDTFKLARSSHNQIVQSAQKLQEGLRLKQQNAINPLVQQKQVEFPEESERKREEDHYYAQSSSSKLSPEENIDSKRETTNLTNRLQKGANKKHQRQQRSKPVKPQQPVRPKKTSAYLQFYQNGYKVLKEMSPSLSGTEITRKLTSIWKKQQQDRKLKEAQEKQKAEGNNKQHQIVQTYRLKIGRINFISHKKKQGLRQIDIFYAWRHLPLESKLRWFQPKQQNIAEELSISNSREISGSVRYGCSHEISKDNSFDWSIFDDLNTKGKVSVGQSCRE